MHKLGSVTYVSSAFLASLSLTLATPLGLVAVAELAGLVLTWKSLVSNSSFDTQKLGQTNR
jgi:hypothetical protein